MHPPWSCKVIYDNWNMAITCFPSTSSQNQSIFMISNDECIKQPPNGIFNSKSPRITINQSLKYIVIQLKVFESKDTITIMQGKKLSSRIKIYTRYKQQKIIDLAPNCKTISLSKEFLKQVVWVSIFWRTKLSHRGKGKQQKVCTIERLHQYYPNSFYLTISCAQGLISIHFKTKDPNDQTYKKDSFSYDQSLTNILIKSLADANYEEDNHGRYITK